MAKDWQHTIIAKDEFLVESIKIQKEIITNLEKEAKSLRKKLKNYTHEDSIDRIEERLNELEGMRIKEIRYYQRLCKELEAHRETSRDLIAYSNSIERQQQNLKQKKRL